MLLTVTGFYLAADTGTPLDSILNPRTTGNGYVSNADHIVSDAATEKLNSILGRLDEEKKAQVAVVLVNSIGKNTPKDFATALFRSWHVGDKETNKGLLILLVKDQHRIEFEVGYGLEGTIPDIISNRIQHQVMIPNLKKGDYDAAILEGINRVDSTISAGTAGSGHEEVQTADQIQDTNGSRLVFIILALLLHILIVCIYAIAFSKKGKFGQASLLLKIFLISGPFLIVLLTGCLTPVKIDYLIVLLIIYCCWSLFFSFYFIGRKQNIADRKNTSRQDKFETLRDAMSGLAVYTLFFPLPMLFFIYIRVKKMLHTIRYAPCKCDHCQQEMQLANDQKEIYLSAAEKMEEKLAGLTYDVWKCEQDGVVLKIPYHSINPKVCSCKKCKNFTALRVKTTIEVKATTSRAGSGYNYFVCQFCGEEFYLKYSIVRKKVAVGNSSSGSRRSDDDNDSSSGSSDSWGGGSSGGAGSGSNW